MLVRSVRTLGIASLFLIGVAAALADDPFVGKWKLNQSKSTMSGQQAKIDALGGNKYRFTYGEISNELVTDGTDQPFSFGRTRAISVERPDTWKVVDKKDGRTLGTATWKLSPDGGTMDLDVSGTNPDGSAFHDHVTRKRIAGTSGFAGTWENTSVNLGLPFEMEVQRYESDGLTFIFPAEKGKLSMKFDGKDYEETGPNAAPGSTSAGRRVNDRTIELTGKLKGNVMNTAVMEISSDGKTLSETVHPKGQSKPLVFVYEKE
jgi:hypothetical protein